MKNIDSRQTGCLQNMPYIFQLLMIISYSMLSLPPCYGAVIFEDNFDVKADWNVNGQFNGDGCSVRGFSNSANLCPPNAYPEGWEAFRSTPAYGGAHSPLSISRLPGNAADHSGKGSGKALVIYNESYPAYSNSSWPGDGVMVKHFGGKLYPELFIQFWMRTQLNFQAVASAQIKFFRAGYWRGLNSSQQNIWYIPESHPGMFHDLAFPSNNVTGYLAAYRCDPDDYYCSNQNNKYEKNDYVYASKTINYIDGNWHKWVFHLKMNTPGVYNGVYEAFIDGASIVQKSDVMWRENNSTATGWSHIMLGGNSFNKYSPKDDQWYAIDDVVISSTPVPDNYVIGGTHK